MTKLIDALDRTSEPVLITVIGGGLDITIYSDVNVENEYVDGVMLLLNDESRFYLSTLVNKVIDIDIKGESTTWTIHNTAINVILTFTVAN